MPDTKRNALAELAKWMEVDIRKMEFGNIAQLKRMQKAKRIVAELAKADATYITDPVHNNICHLAYDALKKCRAIAEEGVGNE